MSETGPNRHPDLLGMRPPLLLFPLSLPLPSPPRDAELVQKLGSWMQQDAEHLRSGSVVHAVLSQAMEALKKRYLMDDEAHGPLSAPALLPLRELAQQQSRGGSPRLLPLSR